MIVLNMFFLSASLSCFETRPGTVVSSLWTIILGAFGLVICPAVGLLSDCYYGRYRVLLASVWILLLGIVLKGIEIVLDNVVIMKNEIIPHASIGFTTLSLTLYVSCIIPFTMDQLVGASGEQFSFTIYWILWPGFLLTLLTTVFKAFLPGGYGVLMQFYLV